MTTRVDRRTFFGNLVSSASSGFSLVDLLFTAALAAFLVIAVLGFTSRETSARAVCHNNLRQIGMGLHRWANDHDDHVPWFTFTNEGGTKPIAGTVGSKTATPWIEILALSNELNSARVLACPQDKETKVAHDFTTGQRGFANSGLRGNALSYSVQFDSDLIDRLRPRTVLWMDRDFKGSGVTGGLCSQAGAGTFNISSSTFLGPVVWTNAVHPNSGNLLYSDGSVELTDNSHLKGSIVYGFGDLVGSAHYSPPR